MSNMGQKVPTSPIKKVRLHAVNTIESVEEGEQPKQFREPFGMSESQKLQAVKTKQARTSSMGSMDQKPPSMSGISQKMAAVAQKNPTPYALTNISQKMPAVKAPQEKEKKAPKRSLWRKVLGKRVPVIFQMTSVECGLASLAMILSYYRRKTSVAELRTQYGVGRDGISALGIVKAARNFGMRVRALSLPQNEFRHVTLPAIVHWEFNHFIVVERWSKKRVDIVDPARGRRRLTEEEFDAGFTGVVIMLEPGVNFNRKSAPKSISLGMYVKQSILLVPGTALQVLGASILLQSFGLILPFATKVVVDHILPLQLGNLMHMMGLGMLVLFLSRAVTMLLREWMLVYLRARIDIHMMMDFLEHLLMLPYSFFQQRSTGDLLSRMESNGNVRDILSSQLIATLLDGTMVIIYLIVLLWQSLPFGLLTLVIGLAQMILSVATSKVITDLSGRELTAQGKAHGYMAEIISGIATLKAAGAEHRAQERWSNLFIDQLNISMRRSYLSGVVQTALAALRSFSPIALLWIGAMQVLDGSMSVGSMLALNALAAAFLDPLSILVARIQQLQLVQAHLERLADVVTAPVEQDRREVYLPPKLTGQIHLKDVSFRYTSDTPKVLHSVNVTIEPGQKVAIVGRTGSGKSTLGKLLLGLYIPTEGTILYDGIPLQKLNYQEVRRQFGVVLQDSTIFSGSVLDNITFNNPSMGKEQVFKAARIAAIHEDIMKMPMGYDTFVSEGGRALSGGQRQRLSLARAIAGEPAILLLDEATSNLDVVTEQRVAQNLQRYACTQIIIAHRLSTVRDADIILVLDQGTIVEKGPHEELLRRGGFYTRLIQQQLEKEEREKIQLIV